MDSIPWTTSILLWYKDSMCTFTRAPMFSMTLMRLNDKSSSHKFFNESRFSILSIALLFSLSFTRFVSGHRHVICKISWWNALSVFFFLIRLGLLLKQKRLTSANSKPNNQKSAFRKKWTYWGTRVECSRPGRARWWCACAWASIAAGWPDSGSTPGWQPCSFSARMTPTSRIKLCFIPG